MNDVGLGHPITTQLKKNGWQEHEIHFQLTEYFTQVSEWLIHS